MKLIWHFKWVFDLQNVYVILQTIENHERIRSKGIRMCCIKKNNILRDQNKINGRIETRKKIEGLGYRRRKRRTECRIVIIKILIVFCSRRIFLLQRWNFSFFYAAKQTEKRKKNQNRIWIWKTKRLAKKFGCFWGIVWWYDSCCNLIIFMRKIITSVSWWEF